MHPPSNHPVAPATHRPPASVRPTRAHRFGTPVLALIAAAALMAGCETMSERERGGATGAAVGAVAGAAIGSATGGSAGASAVIGGVAGAVAGNLWSKRMQDKQRAMEQATAGTDVAVTRTENNELKVNVPADFSFDVGRAEIRPVMRPVLDPFAQGLDPNMRVRIVGHTDNTGSDAINEPLSVRRAEAVRDYLAGRGVSSSRVQVSGRGAREPVATNATDAGRAQNRRVEIYLSEPQA